MSPAETKSPDCLQGFRPSRNLREARRRDLHRSFLLGRAVIFGQERIKVLRKSRGRAAPVGREEMDEMNQRVSCTNDGKGRWPRRSEIYWSGEVKFGVETSRFVGVDLVAAVD